MADHQLSNGQPDSAEMGRRASDPADIDWPFLLLMFGAILGIWTAGYWLAMR